MTSDLDAPLILAADIGATNSRFALFTANPGPVSAQDSALVLVRERWYKGADFNTFTDILQALFSPGQDGSTPFLDKYRPPDVAVIAPAGPIVQEDGNAWCRVSNLPWRIDAAQSASAIGTPGVRLINDFAAQALACLLPEAVNAAPVLPGKAVPGAPLAVTGAGTGFGTALLVNPGNKPAGSGLDGLLRGDVFIMPGEGGHAEFPFVGKEEMDFARFAAREAGTERLIGDAVVSGTGLGLLFTYLTGNRVHPHDAAAKAPAHPEVMRWYARFYARACRVYVLQTLALGGLFVTGGMALRVPVLEHPAFAEELHASAAQGHLLKQLPVFHVRNPQAGLWGAALFGLSILPR